MNATETELVKQTEKWLSKLEKERKRLRPAKAGKGAVTAFRNLDAYISDARYFQKRGDSIRAFEAMVYAWGVLETLKWLGMVGMAQAKAK